MQTLGVSVEYNFQSVTWSSVILSFPPGSIPRGVYSVLCRHTDLTHNRFSMIGVAPFCRRFSGKLYGNDSALLGSWLIDGYRRRWCHFGKRGTPGVGLSILFSNVVLPPPMPSYDQCSEETRGKRQPETFQVQMRDAGLVDQRDPLACFCS